MIEYETVITYEYIRRVDATDSEEALRIAQAHLPKSLDDLEVNCVVVYETELVDAG